MYSIQLGKQSKTEHFFYFYPSLERIMESFLEETHPKKKKRRDSPKLTFGGHMSEGLAYKRQRAFQVEGLTC